MNLCFSTLGCTEKSLEEILVLAKSYKIEGLEIRGIGGIMENASIPALAPECATKTKKMLCESSIKPVSLGTSCSFHAPDGMQKAQEEGESSIRIAKALQIPYIRVFGNHLTEDRDACFARVTDGIRALCDKAIGTDVRVLLEVHGDFNRTETLAPILQVLGEHPNFGLLWDVAHSHRVYGAEWLPFYQTIRPYVHHVHLKDLSDASGALTLPGQGSIPLLPIISQMLEDGYNGYFSLEWESRWHPELPPIEQALACYTELLQSL